MLTKSLLMVKSWTSNLQTQEEKTGMSNKN